VYHIRHITCIFILGVGPIVFGGPGRWPTLPPPHLGPALGGHRRGHLVVTTSIPVAVVVAGGGGVAVRGHARQVTTSFSVL
jgi:hypothetical protein